MPIAWDIKIDQAWTGGVAQYVRGPGFNPQHQTNKHKKLIVETKN